MSQEAMPPRDLVEDWFTIYGHDEKLHIYAVVTDIERLPDDPWVNGRYAFAAIIGGLIAMLTLSVGVSA